MHSRRYSTWILIAATGTTPATTAAAGGPSGPENILVLVADDLGIDALRIYGVASDYPNTPVLDGLAREGVRFRNVWSAPVCSATRATLQTGRYGFRTGIGWSIQSDAGFALSPDELTIPEMLDLGTQGAFTHAAIGKWHLGNATVGGKLAPNIAGYGHFDGTLANIADYWSWTRVVDGVASTSTEYNLSAQIDAAIAFTSTAAEPWYCHVSFNMVHLPFHAPPAALHTVDLSAAGSPASDPRPYYKAMVEALDTEIGRLLLALAPVKDRTTVIFCSDNGTPSQVLPAPFDPQHGKGSLFEPGVRVPLIVTGPRVADSAKDRECAALVNTTDLFATVAEIAGVDLASVVGSAAKLDSVSFAPYLSDPSLPSIRQTVLSEAFVPNGPTNGLPPAPPPDPLCQPDLGGGGPGTLQLSACGQSLAFGNASTLSLTGAPPNATLVLIWSLQYHPTSFGAGTLGPAPIAGLFVLKADGNGTWTHPAIPGADLGLSIFVQGFSVDPTLPGGYGFSNTVALEYPPAHSKAIRGERYKLIRNYNGGPDRLYDLQDDPLELVNLLLNPPLPPEAAAAYALLDTALATLLASP